MVYIGPGSNKYANHFFVSFERGQSYGAYSLSSELELLRYLHPSFNGSCYAVCISIFNRFQEVEIAIFFNIHIGTAAHHSHRVGLGGLSVLASHIDCDRVPAHRHLAERPACEALFLFGVQRRAAYSREGSVLYRRAVGCLAGRL